MSDDEIDDDDEEEKVSRGGGHRKTRRRTIASSASHADGSDRSIIVGDLSSTTEEESKSCVEAIAAGVDDDEVDEDPQAAAKTRRNRASQRPGSSRQRELDRSEGLGAAQARSMIASRLDGDDDSRARGSSVDELLREIARLRRKVRVLTNAQHDNETFAAEHLRELVYDNDDASDYDEAEMMDLEETGGMDRLNQLGLGYSVDDATTVAKGQRPGAYRMRGTGDDSVSQSDDDNDASESDDDTGEVLPWRSNPPVVPPTRLTDRPSDQAMLLEADLVDESDRAVREGADAPLVTAQPIYRRQQILVVAGWNCFVCTILGLFATALLFAVVLTVPRYVSAPYNNDAANFTSVFSAQAEFNGSLSNSTLTAIDQRSSPQAKAYQWLFGNANHPDLPKDAALERMKHRFALVTLYYSTKGGSAWKDKLGWLEWSIHECFWEGVYCRNLPFVKFWEYGSDDLDYYSAEYANASGIDALDLSYNRLTGTIPEEIGLLVTANISAIRFELNSLIGTIPTAMGNLTSLLDLSLFENKLTGSIPPNLGKLRRLTSLALSDNQLTGPVPPDLGHLSSLSSLELFHNTNLSGPFPDEICQKAGSKLNVTVDCDRRGINCSCCVCT